MNYRQNKFATESNLHIIFMKLLKINWLIVFCVIFLGCIGVSSLYSAAGGSWDPWAKNHLIRLIVGTILMFIIAFNYKVGIIL